MSPKTLVTALPATRQRCPQCQRSGVAFYPSQARKGAWCIDCFRTKNRERARAVRAQEIGGASRPILALIQAKPLEERTRREQLVVLRAACPRGRAVCCWCWGEKPLAYFHQNKNNRDGHDQYCRDCRAIRARLALHMRHQQASAVTAERSAS